MYAYSGAATTASQLTPFTEAPATTNDSGQATQAASTAQSAAASTADSTTDSLSAFLTQLNTEMTNFGTELSTLNGQLTALLPPVDDDPVAAADKLGPASVGDERHHAVEPVLYHGRQHAEHLCGRAVDPPWVRQPAEELVAGLHLYPEPRYRNSGHRPAAPPDANHGGAVAAFAQWAIERLLCLAGTLAGNGFVGPGRHHRRSVGSAELGGRDAGRPDGCRRDGTVRG